MQEKIRLNNFDIIDINTCPVLYYSRKKLGVVEESPFSYRGKIVTDLLSEASRNIILEYYSKLITIDDVDQKLVKYFFESILDRVPTEQIEFVTETFNSKYFAAEAERLVAFLKKYNFFDIIHPNALLSFEGENFVYETHIDFIDSKDCLFFIGNGLEISSYRYYNITVIGAYLASIYNKISIKRMKAFPYSISKNFPASISIPNDEQINTFLRNLEDIAVVIQKEDYYPKPQWRCFGCKFETFCKSYRGG